LVVTIIRIYQGYSKTDFFKLCKKKVHYRNFGESLLSKTHPELVKNKQEEFAWIEKKVLENVNYIY
jgi:hypothetical protein